MWQPGTDGSPQREKWEESRKLYFIEEVGGRLGANLTKNETSLPGISLTGGLARKGKWLCARAGGGRAVSSWVTSHCPNCEMQVVPLPTPRHPPGHLQGHPVGLAQPRGGPFLPTSLPIHCPQNFSGICSCYYEDTETQKREEIFLTVILDPKSGALRSESGWVISVGSSGWCSFCLGGFDNKARRLDDTWLR